MKTFGTGLVSLLLVLSLVPMAAAVDTGVGVGIDMQTEEFKPLIWLCDSRTVLDDDLEPGRVVGPPVWSDKLETCECIYEHCYTGCIAGQVSWSFDCNGQPCEVDLGNQITVPQLCVTACERETLKWSCPVKKGYELKERHNNYAFEGEKIEWVALVMDKNKIEQIQDVYVTIGPKRSGRLEDYCAIPPNNIIIDGHIIESKWNGVDFSVDVPPSDCDYDVFLENDCDYLYIAVNVTNELCVPNLGITEVLMQLGGVEVNILGMASESALNYPQAEYKIPLSSLSAQTGDTLRFAFRMFSDNRHPTAGYLSHRLNSKWAKREVYNDVEVQCVRLNGWAIPGASIESSCNVRIQQEELEQFDPQTMAYYECTFTVETPDSMYGEYFVSLEVEDTTGYKTVNDEVEYWFFNPEIALIVEGYLDFGIVSPGTISYSDTLLVGNDADPKSGVLMDMFISGTDFYDPANSGARCVLSNRLKLGNNRVASGENDAGNVCNIGFGDTDDHLCYYATSGAYSTGRDGRSDAEGYVPIVYGNSFTRDFYNDAEIIQANLMFPYWAANLLTPQAEIALNFKLGLPEPCTGDFTDGAIYFWGEAV